MVSLFSQNMKNMDFKSSFPDKFLQKLQSQYEQFLFGDFLPYMDDYIIDNEFGGFMCHTNRSGVNITSNKRTWYDGRGIWVYSFLYQHFGQKEKYLKIARNTIKLVLKMKPKRNEFWPEVYTREGRPLSGEPGDIYGGLFIAEGLAAYSRASEQPVFLEKAKAILFDSVNRYDDVKYQYKPHYDSTKVRIIAPRVLGHWMVLLNVSRQILDQEPDPKVKKICDRCIENLLEHHLQPDSNLMIEYLNHDFSNPGGRYAQFSLIGHAIEALWMLMAEAERRKDQNLFSQAAGLFQRHVEIAWDDVFGGFFHCMNNVDKNDWLLDKVLWAQEEVMVGLMLLLERDEGIWAKIWIPKVWNYLNRSFVLRDHPTRLWINGGDRRLNQHHQVDRLENYHHPRHLMLNILRLNRMALKYNGGHENNIIW